MKRYACFSAALLIAASASAQVVGGGPVIGGGGSGGSGTIGGSTGATDNTPLCSDGTGGSTTKPCTSMVIEGATADDFEGNFTFADPTADWTVNFTATGIIESGNFPASSTANAIARFDSTTGKLLKNSSVTITDTGTLAATVSSGIQALIVGRSAGAVLEVYPSTTDVQIGTIGSHPLGFYVANGSPSLLIPVGGGIDITDKGTRPTCDSTVRGTFWVDEGGAGVADVASVCAKDGADAYAWHDLY